MMARRENPGTAGAPFLEPMAGDHIFTCLCATERWHWMSIHPPQELRRSDGSRFDLKHIRLCPECQERQLRGENVEIKERIWS